MKKSTSLFILCCFTFLWLNELNASPETDRAQYIAGMCAQASITNGVDFGDCISRDLTNQEAQIAYQCAKTSWSGGPYAVAGCTAARLTSMEFDKCQRGIGTQEGCFGPNNTVRRFVENAGDDLHYGPGEHNDLVGKKGWVCRTLFGGC